MTLKVNKSHKRQKEKEKWNNDSEGDFICRRLERLP